MKEYLANRDVYTTLTDAARQLRIMVPDGKTVHRRNSTLGLIATWADDYRSERRTFSQLSRDDGGLYESMMKKLDDAVGLGVML